MHDSFCQLLLKLTQLALQHHVLLEIPFTSYSRSMHTVHYYCFEFLVVMHSKLCSQSIKGMHTRVRFWYLQHTKWMD